MKIGSIVIENGHIHVCTSDCTSTSKLYTKTSYDSVTIENLNDAARVLAAWMDIPSEDVATDCQRIHARDQQLAAIKEMINDSVRHMRDDDAHGPITE